MLGSIVLFDPYNNLVMWAHFLTIIFKDEEKNNFERLHDDFSQEGKLFWIPNPIFLYCMIFLLIRGIGLALKCLKIRERQKMG